MQSEQEPKSMNTTEALRALLEAWDHWPQVDMEPACAAARTALREAEETEAQRNPTPGDQGQAGERPAHSSPPPEPPEAVDDVLSSAPRAPLGDSVGTDDKIEAAIELLGSIMDRAGGAKFRMRIPAQETDDDIVLAKALHAAKTEIAALRAQLRDATKTMVGLCAQIERGEAQLRDWEDGAKRVMAENCGDERHCTCVPTLRKLLREAKRTDEERLGWIASLEAQLRERPTQAAYDQTAQARDMWKGLCDARIHRAQALEAMRQAWGLDGDTPDLDAILDAVLAKRKAQGDGEPASVEDDPHGVIREQAEELRALRAQLREADNTCSARLDGLNELEAQLRERPTQAAFELQAELAASFKKQRDARPTRERYAAIEAENLMLKKKLNWDPIVDDSIDHLVTRDEALEAMRGATGLQPHGISKHEGWATPETLEAILDAVLAKRKGESDE